jgi:hypothetical protein
MQTFDLDLRALKSKEAQLLTQSVSLAEQIEALTQAPTPASIDDPVLNTLRLQRCLTMSRLHDIQSRLQIEQAQSLGRAYLKIVESLFPDRLVTVIPAEFKPECHPGNEIGMLEQRRETLYQKMESAEIRSNALAAQAKLLAQGNSVVNQDEIEALLQKREKAVAYFEQQSIKVLRTRKRLYQLYSRLPERILHRLTVSNVSVQQDEIVREKLSMRPVFRRRILSSR